MLVRVFALLTLTCLLTAGEWPSPPHPLAYFRVDPCLRPESDLRGGYFSCDPPSTTELKRRVSVTTELREVGRIGTLKIYDLWYSRGIPGSWGGDPSLRSILVETAPSQFREIDVQIRRGDLFPASEIVEIDAEQILIAKSHDGGNHNRIDEKLYIVRLSGIESPDFKAVGEAVAKLTPPNMSLRGWIHDYAAKTELVELYRNDLGLPPVSVTERAKIFVTYRFVNGHAVVTGSKYEPYSR